MLIQIPVTKKRTASSNFWIPWSLRNPRASSKSRFTPKLHTDQYLDFQSHHPLEHKISVIRTLMHRAETTVTEPSDLAVGKDHIKFVLKNCGYQNWVFSNSDRKSEANQREPTGRRSYSTLPCIHDISNKISRAYKKAGVHTSFKPHKTLRQLLVAPKDKPPRDQLAGTVYCLECEDCHNWYIGESTRLSGQTHQGTYHHQNFLHLSSFWTLKDCQTPFWSRQGQNTCSRD